MKKILFVTLSFDVGGIEKSLLETIKVLKSAGHEISIAALSAQGDLYEEFLKYCRIIDLTQEYKNSFMSKKQLISDLRKFKFLSFLIKVFKRVYETHFCSIWKRNLLRSKRMPKIHEQFDVAVAYHDPYSIIVPFVAEYINAKTKYTWIHRDVLTDKDNQTVKEYDKVFHKFDKIICVSNSAEKSFLSRQPNCSGCTLVINNPMDCTLIQESTSTTDLSFIKNCEFSICSVGRLHPDKGFDIAVSACKFLKERGYKIGWYICGEGLQRESLNALIVEKHLENEFILLGNKLNPYFYIAKTDIYVQPSRTESYCLTLAEARALKKPIVTTNFPCASEHVVDGHNGFICEMTPESIADAIEKMILSPELRDKFSENTTPVDIDNTKLKQLFE